MSYDLAVWEGPQPKNDKAAGEMFLQLTEQADPTTPPTPAIKAYVLELLERWPDITDNDDEDSPWSDGPLIANAMGPLFHFGMVYSKCGEGSEYAVEVAARHGLVCFDPQGWCLQPGNPEGTGRRGLFRRKKS